MAKYRIKQTRSKIGSSKRQKLTLEALGLRRINHVVEQDANPQVLGMINAVKHLVSFEEIK
jgi:large subunit ribosomal protein L30